MTNQGGRAPSRSTGGGGGRRGAGGPNGPSGPGGFVGAMVAIGGNDRGKQFTLPGVETQIGRGADQDIILADIAVSRRHVVVLVEGDRYRIKDLGSGNGTLINGVRTATALLTDGDQIEIGNTVLRFDHPPSSARTPTSAPVVQPASTPQRPFIAEPPQQNQGSYQGYSPAPAYAPPVPSYPPQYAPQYSSPHDASQYTPSGAIAAQPMRAPARPSRGQDVGRRSGGGWLDTPAKKALVFGSAGVVVLLAIGLVAKSRFSDGKDEADRLFLDGKGAFKDRDYDRAKRLFAESLKGAPDAPQTQTYLKQCDVEIRARAALKTAQGLGAARKWVDALGLLDGIDKASDSYEDAEKLRKQAVPEVVKTYLLEARVALASDPSDRETAKQKIEAALLLDPESAAAQELEAKIKGGSGSRVVAIAPAPVAAAPVAAEQKSSARTARATALSPAPPEREPSRAERESSRTEREPSRAEREPSRATAPARSSATRGTSSSRRSDDDDDDNDEAAPSSGGGGDLMSSRAFGPYRARDFAGAANALRSQAQTQRGVAAQKSLALAGQVGRLGDAYTKAEADKARNPAQAMAEYQLAASIDTSIARGTHNAYFKSQSGKLAKDAALQAFTQQHFDIAYEMVKTAQRAGGDDGGVLAKLKAKAQEVNSKASAMWKTNPNGAKMLWRNVIKMVPPGDPAYVTATRGLSASQTVKDEDED